MAYEARARVPGEVVARISDSDIRLYQGDVLDALGHLSDDAVDAVVTSPPYLDLRPEYPSPVEWEPIFVELARVTVGGMLWNVGRRWRNHVEDLWWLELIGAAKEAGWQHRDTLLWVKLNPNPIQGEVLANAHEYVLAFGRDDRDFQDVRVPYAEGSIARLRRRWVSSVSVKGDTSERNGKRRDEKRGMRREENEAGARAPGVFVVPVGTEKGNPHPAPMPLALAKQLIEVVAPPGATVLDPFAGSCTTLLAARELERSGVGIELDPDYCDYAVQRLAQQSLFAAVDG